MWNNELINNRLIFFFLYIECACTFLICPLQIRKIWFVACNSLWTLIYKSGKTKTSTYVLKSSAGHTLPNISHFDYRTLQACCFPAAHNTFTTIRRKLKKKRKKLNSITRSTHLHPAQDSIAQKRTCSVIMSNKWDVTNKKLLYAQIHQFGKKKKTK